jgi:gamma-glutamyltranspeptidase / glutathione hydrolase
MAPGAGILLNNSLSNFSVTTSHAANYAAPGKRPRSTVAPIIVTRWNRPSLALGLPGGQRIPTTAVQLMVDVLDFGLPLPEAIAQRRFHLRRPLKPEDPVNMLDVEGLPPRTTRDQLASDGWRMIVQRPDGHFFGGATAVAYQKNGTMLGVADLRRSNLALGD